MCGFAGYVDLRGDGRVSRDLAVRMADTLRHRGPDGSGCYVDRDVALGFRRLRILDLETGDQPMFNEDGSLVLLCNGEIYDYLELRDRLARRGHRFSSRGDVETLLHLYEDEGADFLAGLNGQFAFAIWDRNRRELFLARDHFGVVPLFFTVVDGFFVFGSEIKALLAHPSVPREVDLTGLDQVLCFPGLVSPRTMFKGVHSLKSGHFVKVADGEVRVREYWDLEYPRLGEAEEEWDEEEAAGELLDRLRRSVRRRLQADVPVGVYLSGGLDSSLIASLIRAETPHVPRSSFSITFGDEAMSEAGYQRTMAEHLDCSHHEIRFEWEELAQRLERTVFHSECPVKETYNTCSFALSEAARRGGVKAVLSGEGADELFAGYVGYRFDHHLDGRRDDGDDLDALLEAELRQQVWGDPNLVYETDFLRLQEVRETLYSEAVRAQLPEVQCVAHEVVDRSRVEGRHPLHQRSYLDLKLRLADHLVGDHGDRMALANSVEGRYPFLDLDVVELARRLPPGLKLRRGQEKYVLKRAAGDLVPREVVAREKFGFHAPGSPYLLRRKSDRLEELLAPETIEEEGYFDPQAVQALRKRYLEDDFVLNLPFESDLLLVVLTFGIFRREFDLPTLQ